MFPFRINLLEFIILNGSLHQQTVNIDGLFHSISQFVNNLLYAVINFQRETYMMRRNSHTLHVGNITKTLYSHIFTGLAEHIHLIRIFHLIEYHTDQIGFCIKMSVAVNDRSYGINRRFCIHNQNDRKL